MECSMTLALTGLFFIFYWLFFIIRGLAITVSMYVCKVEPFRLHLLSRLIFLIIDILVMPIAAIYGSAVLASDETSECTNKMSQDTPDVKTFRNVLIFNVILAYGYMICLLIFGCFIFCIYKVFMTMSEA